MTPSQSYSIHNGCIGQLSQQVCLHGVYMYYGYTPGKGYSGLSGAQVEILGLVEDKLRF